MLADRQNRFPLKGIFLLECLADSDSQYYRFQPKAEIGKNPRLNKWLFIAVETCQTTICPFPLKVYPPVVWRAVLGNPFRTSFTTLTDFGTESQGKPFKALCGQW